MREDDATRYTNPPAGRAQYNGAATNARLVREQKRHLSDVDPFESDVRTFDPQNLIAERWELLEHIGEGGMSDVFKARHVLMNKVGAVKFLKGNLSTDPVAVKRFQQEALACGTLTHANIVQTYDCGLSERGFYLILEYLEGVSLADILDDLSANMSDGNGRLSLEEAVPIFTQICDSLEHAHQKGIVHRDIKPSNVMLVTTGGKSEQLVKLVDFGIAKLVGRGSAAATLDGSLTLSGEVFGSPLYMSPEQCMGKSVDGRSDIYSLGCLMYETIVGKRAILGKSPTETMMKHVHDAPEIADVKEIKDPAALMMHDIIARCLEKEPEDRYQTMQELEADLHDLPLASKRSLIPHGRSAASSLVIFGLAVLAGIVCTIMGLAIYYLLPAADYSAVARAEAVPLAPPALTIGNISGVERDTSGEASAGSQLKNAQAMVELPVADGDVNKRAEALISAGDKAFGEKHYYDSARFFNQSLALLKNASKSAVQAMTLKLQSVTGYARACYYLTPEELTRMQATADEVEFQLSEVLHQLEILDSSKYSEKLLQEAYEWKARLQLSKQNYGGAIATIAEMLSHFDNDTVDKASWIACEADLKRLFSNDAESQTDSATLFRKALDVLNALKSNDEQLRGEINYRLALVYQSDKNVDAKQTATTFNTAADCFIRAADKVKANKEENAMLRLKARAAKRMVFDSTREYDSFAALLYKVRNGV